MPKRATNPAPSREEAAFKIKNANLPVLILHLKTADTARVKAQLETRLKQMPDFFAHAPVVLGLGELAPDAEPDFPDLLDFMRSHHMQAAGVIGGSAAQQFAATQAGLGVIPEIPARPTATSEPEPPVESLAEPQPDPGPVQPELPGPENETQVETEAELATPAPSPESRPTLVIDKPVRTGQRIYAEGANLVVLAIVNAGAELIADGDIHIYAPLRGRALAGARGNTAARIYVQSMEAELVAIAGYFQVFDEGIPETLRGKFCQIRLEGEKVVTQAMNSSR